MDSQSRAIASIEISDDRLIIRFAGDVTLETIGNAREKIAEAVNANPRPLVTVDVTRVPFIDSAGLALIVGIYRMPAVDQKLELRARGGSQPDRVLKLSAMNRLFPVILEP